MKTFFDLLEVLHLILGARRRSSYPLEKFLSEALGEMGEVLKVVTPYGVSEKKRKNNFALFAKITQFLRPF